MTSLSNEALNLVEEELKSLRAKVATLTVERNTWNNSFHGANVERIKLKDQCERFLEEKEAWKQCCWEMVHGVMRVTHPANCECSDCISYMRFSALVEKYK